jgi:AcrR family transcriptional regulator
MNGKHARARPRSGADQAGGQHIIYSVRAMLRARRSDWASRKSLARFSGISPALVTHYFPDKVVLVEEATKPIVEEYARQLRAILDSTQAPDAKLREIISLLVTCYKRDAGILDAYQELARQKKNMFRPNYVAMMIDDLENFFGDWSHQEKVAAPPAMLQGALWGMCQLVAQANSATEISDQERQAGDLDSKTTIYHLMTGGLDRLKLYA